MTLEKTCCAAWNRNVLNPLTVGDCLPSKRRLSWNGRCQCDTCSGLKFEQPQDDGSCTETVCAGSPDTEHVGGDGSSDVFGESSTWTWRSVLRRAVRFQRAKLTQARLSSSTPFGATLTLSCQAPAARRRRELGARRRTQFTTLIYARVQFECSATP